MPLYIFKTNNSTIFEFHLYSVNVNTVFIYYVGAVKRLSFCDFFTQAYGLESAYIEVSRAASYWHLYYPKNLKYAQNTQWRHEY